MFKRIAALLTVPMLLSAQQPTPEPRLITLDEAVRLAQQNSPSAMQARGTLRTRALAVRSAYSAFLPTLNGSVGLGRPLEAPARGPRQWSHSSSISSSLTLFDPLRYYDVGEAKRNVDVAEAAEIQNRYSVALQVKQQYFNALNARESEAAARSALAVAEQSYRAAVARVRAGSATTSDSLRALIQVGNQQIAVLTAQNNLRQANVGLSRLVGTDFPVQADPADTLDRAAEAAIDSASLVLMVDRGPVLEQQRAQLELARYGVKSARTRYWPRISSVNISRSGNGIGFYGFDDHKFDRRPTAEDPNGVDAYSYSTQCCNVSVSMTFWDNFARENQLVASRIQVENAEANLRDQELGQQQSLAQWIGTLRTTQAQMAVQRLSLAAAEEDLRVQQRRYQLGASTFLDVLNSQVTLNQARFALIQARFDARVAKAQIETLTGKDM